MNSVSSLQPSPPAEEASSETDTSLSTQRWQLQEEIISLLNSDAPNKEKEALLHAKKVSYNQIMERLQPPRQRSNPMDKFPTEIMEKIILDLITEYSEIYQILEKKVELLLPLAMVSKQWKDFIWSAPIFWNCVTAYGYMTNAIARVVQGLALSRNLSLTVIVHIFPCLWHDIRPFLLPHRQRIVTFVNLEAFHDLRDRCPEPEIYGKEMLLDLVPLPKLRLVNGDWGNNYESDDVVEFFDHAPSLESLSDLDLDSNLLFEAKSRLRLREFDTCCDIAEILPTLEKFPSIQRITFRSDYKDEDPPLLSFRSNEPFNWTHLHYPEDHARRTSLTPLFHRLPVLTYLNITLGIEQFLDITVSLHRLQCLREYIVDIQLKPGDLALLLEPILPVKPNYTIQRLEISVSKSSRFSSMEPNRDVPNISPIISEMMTEAAPAIETMSFLKNIGSLSHWRLDKYGRLKNISITPYETNVDVCIPSCIQTMSIFCVDLATWSLRPYPCIRTLNIHRPTESYSRERSTVPETFMDLEEWPALESLNLPSIYSRFRGASLSSLRSITLKTAKYSWKIDTNITLFIKELAECVNNYPCLEEIHLDECPDWDILMIMLERRNILASSRIKPIRKLSLPSICPSSISQLFPGLLAGKWVQRPSNLELSQAGNANLILDPKKYVFIHHLCLLYPHSTPF
jgi:hypothetical protein